MAGTACGHENFEAQVEVHRLSEREGGDVTQFVAELTIKCTACAEPFGFRGPPAGHSWTQPRVRLDATEIHLPLMSPAELALAGPLPAMARGRMAYEVHP